MHTLWQSTTLWVTVGASGGWAIFSLIVLIATCCEFHKMLLPLSWVLFFFAAVQLLLALLIVYWVFSLDGITYDMLAETVGQTLQLRAANIIDRAFSVPLSVVEGFTCTAYVKCCKDPALDAPGGMGTCSKPHEGVATDATDALLDPSSANFCAYITGAPRKTLISPPAGACLLLDAAVSGLDLPQCQAQFCASGVDGHVAFVTKVVDAMYRFALPLGAGCAAMLILQIIYACNVRSARKHIRDQKRRWKEYRVGSGTNAPVPPPNVKPKRDRRFSSVLGV